ALDRLATRENHTVLAVTHGSRDSQFLSGAKRNTIAPSASFGSSRSARLGSIAGQPWLRPALFGVTYGAPCATTPRASALSLKPVDTPSRRSPTEVYARPPEWPLNA